jgi:hypothetical protein
MAYRFGTKKPGGIVEGKNKALKNLATFHYVPLRHIFF